MEFRGIVGRVAVVMLVCVAAVQFASGQSSRDKEPAKPLPNLVLNDIDGKKWSLYENRGHIVLLNFWATWCAPCRTETPMLVKLGKEYKDAGLRVVGVALDEGGEDAVRQFVRDYKIDYPILLPVPGSLLARIDPVPTTLLIDLEGRLAEKYVGAVPEEVIRADVERVVAAAANRK